ncbi:Up-regulated during septation-domain-containing protein [Thamnidium elegans]|nr:Up-regulated during septation-domain-containing protein [Thamnidium elegans]
MELGNLWNMKPVENYDTKFNDKKTSMFSSGNLLTQLLVSQALLDSNQFKILSFEKLDNLKKEQVELHQHINNISKSIELERRIKKISKSLENINLKNSRNSILYLERQRQGNDDKISRLSSLVEDLKFKEINMKKIILQHTAAVLNKGIQNIESTPTPTTPVNHHYSDNIALLESELNHVSSKVDYLLSDYCSCTNIPSHPLQKIQLLDQQLAVVYKSMNQIDDNENKQKLLSIEKERDILLSKLVDMELKSTKLLATMTSYSGRQRALKFELLQFKGESIELQIWDRLREKQEYTNIPPAPALITAVDTNQYKQQLKEQSLFYEANIEQQNITLEQDSQQCRQLELDCQRLNLEKSNLDDLIKEKSKVLDQQDNQISRLNADIRNQKQVKNEPYRPESNQEKERLKKVFAAREEEWTQHTHSMEDSFDELLENFDKLTNTAIEFDSHRMRYDRTVDELNQNIHQLELELIEEKVKRIGCSQSEPTTTASLRKEFRILVADIKRSHQERMDQEAQEIKRLQSQLQELQDSNANHKFTGYSMAIQTDF